ncbi:MAG TPA: RidA family protein, partial [Proteobacteria bacterium]|nr:RidA family protein [Pseudomonadota bacterium]
MMEKVFTEKAPKPIGPYSQAIVAGGLVFCAGQIGLDPASGKLAGEDIASQTKQALENLSAVLDAAGAKGLAFVNIYTTDISQFGIINEV